MHTLFGDLQGGKLTRTAIQILIVLLLSPVRLKKTKKQNKTEKHVAAWWFSKSGWRKEEEEQEGIHCIYNYL